MATIALLDHSYHRKTKSTAFLSTLLREHGHDVTTFWDESWNGGAAIGWSVVADHDVIIMFQSMAASPKRTFREVHPNVVYIPMFDQFGFSQGPLPNLDEFWRPFRGSKVLNFSRALHTITLAFGIASHHAKFYLPPSDDTDARTGGLSGFFWLRRPQQIPWQTIRTLCADADFESFHVHIAPDPGSPEANLPTPEDITRFNLTTSTWFESNADLLDVVRRANVYFAPRPEEGIGQSFLEAMARGQCVVAPDNATMNEYITDGLDGILYDPGNPKPLDFSQAAQIGEMARTSVQLGSANWERAQAALERFVLTPSDDVYGQYQNARMLRAHPSLRFMSKYRSLAPKWVIDGLKRFI